MATELATPWRMTPLIALLVALGRAISGAKGYGISNAMAHNATYRHTSGDKSSATYMSVYNIKRDIVYYSI